jgi:glycerol-1-phosphate dehydrogenase [NAD(P)+]
MSTEEGILVSDFDGTMTRNDFYRLAIESLVPPGTPDFWQEYRSGACTHFEALRRYFATIRKSESEVLEVVDRMELDPKLSDAVSNLRQAGWRVVVASAGCDWYIRRLLAKADVEVEVHANPGRFETGRGLLMEMPVDSPFQSKTLGVDKARIVRRFLDEGWKVAFAGDGFPDAESARLVAAVRPRRSGRCARRRGPGISAIRDVVRHRQNPSATGGLKVLRPTQISIPTLVRVKDGALDRLGVYLARGNRKRVGVLISQGLTPALTERVARSLRESGIEAAVTVEVANNDLESAARLFANLPKGIDAVVGVGGGKALDVAKYVGFLSRLPYYAAPTSLSNDGFCSPQSSLTIQGKRRSLPAALPFGLVIDTAVCREAPWLLTLSGVGDLVAKFTAVRDWKLAFHATGEPVDDFAALLSDGSIHAFLSHPRFDSLGMRLLATVLMLNGIAMEICGSSRPASGSEHLISHALDMASARPRLHGLQVGVAAYLVSILQEGENTERIASLFETTGFWEAIANDPFSRAEWLAAVEAAPSVKGDGFYTVLSSRSVRPEVERILAADPYLRRCFADPVPATRGDA